MVKTNKRARHQKSYSAVYTFPLLYFSHLLISVGVLFFSILFSNMLFLSIVLVEFMFLLPTRIFYFFGGQVFLSEIFFLQSSTLFS